MMQYALIAALLTISVAFASQALTELQPRPQYNQIHLLAEEVLSHAGYYFRIPKSKEQQIADKAHELGVYEQFTGRFSHNKKRHEQKQREKMKQVFKELHFDDSRMMYVQSVMLKKPIEDYDGDKVYKQLYGHYERLTKEPMRAFAKALFTSFFRKHDSALTIVMKDASRLNEIVEKLNCNEHQVFVNKDISTRFENIVTQAEKVARERKWVKPLVVEAVAISMVELFRVTPCVIKSVDKVDKVTKDVFDILGIEDAERTVFDLKGRLVDHYDLIVEESMPEAAKNPKLEGSLDDAKIYLAMVSRMHNDWTPKMRPGMLRDLFHHNEFAKGSRLAAMKKAIQEEEQ